MGEHRFESNESYSDLHPNPPLLSVAPILLRVEHFLAFRCGEHTHHSPRAGRVTGGPTVHPRESFNRSGGSGQIGGDGAQRSARVADQRAQIPIAEPGSVPRHGRILSTNSTKESAADSKVATASNTIAPLSRTHRRGTSRVTAPAWWIGVVEGRLSRPRSARRRQRSPSGGVLRQHRHDQPCFGFFSCSPPGLVATAVSRQMIRRSRLRCTSLLPDLFGSGLDKAHLLVP